MEPEIKSSYDKERNRRNKRRWSHRMDYLWMVPLYLLKQIWTLFVKYPYVSLAIVILIVASVLFSKVSKTSSIKVTTTEHIGTTTNQIQSIREIRQWEALAIECEEWWIRLRNIFRRQESRTHIHRNASLRSRHEKCDR